jgi:hypothetical protein
VDDDFTCLDFGDFRGDEGGCVADAGILVEFPFAVPDEFAGE